MVALNWDSTQLTSRGKDHNAAEQFIANLDESTAHNIKVTAQRDGSFTVTNDRNGLTKAYKAVTSSQ